ncbi:MAG: folylpolyglutamate synthase/dihydrofolate synthase family protein [Verrucomicrobiota bacterium]
MDRFGEVAGMNATGESSGSDFDQVRDFLYSLRNQGSKYGLERMVRFSERAGNPQSQFPAIHVAGTNGKGSVCAMVEAALRAQGRSTGLYTSPHLVHLGERIQINRQPIPETEIVVRVEELRKIALREFRSEEDSPSFFEYMTLLAFSYFAQKAVDCAVVEVGLGGRLDATNIVRPLVSVITSIGLDHTEILGDTLGKIAAEKAGILKEGVPVVIGVLPEEAEEVVRKRSSLVGCPVVSVRERFTEEELPQTSLAGAFQRWNAGVAHLAMELAANPLSLDPAEFEHAFLRTDWPGRWETRVIGGKRVVFDSTHNPEGAAVLEENLRTLIGPASDSLDVVVGSLGKDRAEAVLRVVSPFAMRIHIVRPSQPRALSFAEMRELVPSEFKGEVLDASVGELFPGGSEIRVPQATNPVLVTGSLYLIGEIFSRIDSQASSLDFGLQDKI